MAEREERNGEGRRLGLDAVRRGAAALHRRGAGLLAAKIGACQHSPQIRARQDRRIGG